jgi:arylformamidase
VRVIDISLPIRPGMTVYPGDPDVHLERVASIDDGEAANLSRLDFGVHTGTHVDAPVHFLNDGQGAEALQLDALIGPAHVVDATALDRDIDDTALEQVTLPPERERLIFKTRNSELWNEDGFSDGAIRFIGSGARRLLELGVRLVAIDYLSIGDEEAHRILLGAGVVPVEGLDLRHVAPGPYTLACLPLRIVGSDGAPARAVLIAD